MKMEFIKKIFPTIIKYTEKVPNKFAGVAFMCFIKILPKYRFDVGLLKHEMTHVLQWYFWLLISMLISLGLHFFNPEMFDDTVFGYGLIIGACLHGAMYTLIPKYKLFAEVMAYRVQLHYCDKDRVDLFAKFITERYNLDVDIEEVKKLLRK